MNVFDENGDDFSDDVDDRDEDVENDIFDNGEYSDENYDMADGEPVIKISLLFHSFYTEFKSQM